MQTISGRQISATPNYSARTFTIRVEGSKYRTIRLSKDEFQSCENNTGNDWQNFLRSNDYYPVQK